MDDPNFKPMKPGELSAALAAAFGIPEPDADA